ncbi:hypothetical protein [Thalassoporum mexicanum]|uniref:hypothetical protein n=1 Tax=Thalassoporum mexicanum TaxID=3457544 RepID=UPI0005A16BFB|nr:hypothetical protein [Pseudanabaena sp. PCC 7367]
MKQSQSGQQRLGQGANEGFKSTIAERPRMNRRQKKWGDFHAPVLDSVAADSLIKANSSRAIRSLLARVNFRIIKYKFGLLNYTQSLATILKDKEKKSK